VLAAALAAALALAAPPKQGVLVPGRTLGGVGLGATKAEVTRAWGARHGVCRNCSTTTWYFSLVPFEPNGAAVAFRGNKAVAVYTLWSPAGWHTREGLVLGAPGSALFPLYSPLQRMICIGYDVWTLTRGGSVTAFYVYNDALWGFGLLRPGEAICR
jgi:hypothetical protein